jgi:cytochrome P450
MSLQSTSGMKTFVLCTLLHPSIQRRAQAEIDKVVGHDRLPTLADRSDLPYLNACLKESSRWAPVGSEGVAHLSRVDDVYNGYLIPAGTVMIPNMWYKWYLSTLNAHWPYYRNMAHDPEIYSDPLIFRPERFLGSNPEPDPDFTFGFGRRVCPGQVLAQTSTYVLAAHLLALFDIIPAQGPDGEPIEVKAEFDGQGTVVYVYARRPLAHVR